MKRRMQAAVVTAIVTFALFVIATSAYAGPSSQGLSHGKGHKEASSVSQDANTSGPAVKSSSSHDPHHEEADGCDHGATGKPCRPDPQPTHGKDCDKHGNHGGINEDHCGPATTTTTTCPHPTTTTTQPPVTTTTIVVDTTTTQPPVTTTTTKKHHHKKPPVNPTTPTSTGGSLPRTGSESVPTGALGFGACALGAIILLVKNKMKLVGFIH